MVSASGAVGLSEIRFGGFRPPIHFKAFLTQEQKRLFYCAVGMSRIKK